MRSYWMQTDGVQSTLELRDLPTPEAGPGQLLVRMHAAGLNRGEFILGHGLHKAGAAKAIGIGRTTIYKLIADGRLPIKRFGRRVLVRRSDLEALLQQPDPEAAKRGALRRRGRPLSLGG